MKSEMTPDEYISLLERDLIEPEKYIIKGNYNFIGRKNIFSGNISIDKKGVVVGEILDPNSVCSKHVVKSEIFYANDAFLFNFVKIPTGILANIYYKFKKEDNMKKIDGKYKGMWHFNESVLKLDATDFEKEEENGSEILLRKI